MSTLPTETYFVLHLRISCPLFSIPSEHPPSPFLPPGSPSYLFIAVPSLTSSVFPVQSGGRGVKLPGASGKANSGHAEVGGPGGGAQGVPEEGGPGGVASLKAASSGQRH